MNEDNKILIYTDNSGLTRIDVKLEDETLWLTQAQMCDLYQTSKSNVSEHIKHIFDEGELQEDAVVRKFRTTASDGKSYMTNYYNLDANLDNVMHTTTNNSNAPSGSPSKSLTY